MGKENKVVQYTELLDDIWLCPVFLFSLRELEWNKPSLLDMWDWEAPLIEKHANPPMRKQQGSEDVQAGEKKKKASLSE